MSIPNDYHFYRSYYIKQQIARIDAIYANPEVTDGLSYEELSQLDAERTYWMKKLVSKVTR